MAAGSEGSVVERVEEINSQCRHHWMIDIAGGPKSKGVCRICGAEQLFKNALDSIEWDNSESTSATAQRISIAAASPNGESADDI